MKIGKLLIGAGVVVGVGVLACYGLKKLLKKVEDECECCNCDAELCDCGCECECHAEPADAAVEEPAEEFATDEDIADPAAE